MGFFDKFNKLGKTLPNTTEVLKVPSKLKEASVNTKLNQIAIRYFTNNFHYCSEIIGYIDHSTDIPLVKFDNPFNGAILLIEDFTFINRSRNNELTIDICDNYPFGIDKNSDLIRFDNVKYYNHVKDAITEKVLGKSKGMYYKDRKFFIPVMLNQIPLPIIRLDDADRLQPVNKKYVKKLATITQNFLRAISDVKLLERVGSKSATGYVYVAILFTLIGMVLMMIISAFL